jgi:hypothetical protein
MSDHPDLETLPLEINGTPVRETIREIFRNPANGTPDTIIKAGCLALALKGNGLGDTNNLALRNIFKLN